MSALASESMLSDFSVYIRSLMGVSFPRERWGELERKTSQAAASLGFPDAVSCMQWMITSHADRRQREILASWLTVGETFFFREKSGLRALSERVFPEIIRAHAQGDKRVRIWSAGCCTGEEPYSLAMIVSEYPGLHGWDTSILGTDINQTFLGKAKDGIYTEWSFRGVAPGIREKFFRRMDESHFEVLPALKGMVSFLHLNLIDDVYPSLMNATNAIDLIVCRNVLMYFAPDYARNVIHKLQQSLLPQGWLLVSPVEAPLIQGPDFMPIQHTGAILHRKAEQTPRRESVGHEQRSTRLPRPPARVIERPNARAMFDRAKGLYADADYEGTIEILSPLAARHSAGAAALHLLSHAYANKGMLTEAGKLCMRAIAADTTNAASRYLLALIRTEQQKPDEAMSALRKAIYLEPDFVVAHLAFANLCRSKGKREESERHIRNALLVLQGLRSEEELPESEGMTAGRLIEMIRAARDDGGSNGQQRTDR
jgi:chemotaxis protein methyltransferase CheR